jgi:hypothetical protein
MHAGRSGPVVTNRVPDLTPLYLWVDLPGHSHPVLIQRDRVTILAEDSK